MRRRGSASARARAEPRVCPPSRTARAAAHSSSGATRRRRGGGGCAPRAAHVERQPSLQARVRSRRLHVPHGARRCRLIQHKREAYWFYRFLSSRYDRWVNPLFWTLADARAGARAAHDWTARTSTRSTSAPAPASRPRASSSGSTPAHVTMLDQSPHQLARARRKPALRRVPQGAGRRRGPAVRRRRVRPLRVGRLDRVLAATRSARVAEAYRVLRPAASRCSSARCGPTGALARALARAWMLFPAADEYRAWMRVAPASPTSPPFTSAPDWHADGACRTPWPCAGPSRRRGVRRSRSRPSARISTLRSRRATGCASPARFRRRLAGRRGVRARRRGARLQARRARRRAA